MGASEKTSAGASPESPLANGSNGGESSQRFDDILTRLRGVVEKLEGGNLSLEDSLKFFEEGIGLCRRGATILDSAERKVEVLLGTGSTGIPRTAPFDAPAGDDD